MANNELQIVNHNTEPKELSKSVSWLEFMDPEIRSIYPGRGDGSKALIYTMIKWASDPDKLDVLQFCMEYKIPRRTLLRWAENHPDIGLAYEDMKLALSCNRRIGCMRKQLDAGSCFKDMHRLDPDYIEINRYHHEMKTLEADRGSTFNVHLPRPGVTSPEEMRKEQENV